MSVEELSDSQSKTLKPILQNSLLFVFGFSLVFIAMGASAGFLGGALLKYRDVLQLLGGILVIFFGLYIMGESSGISSDDTFKSILLADH